MREGWEYKKLGEVCEIYQPRTLSTDMLTIQVTILYMVLMVS